MHNMSNNMSNNMQNMQKCWEGLLQSYRSYFAYICTPDFADAGTQPAGAPRVSQAAARPRPVPMSQSSSMPWGTRYRARESLFRHTELESDANLRLGLGPGDSGPSHRRGARVSRVVMP